MSIMIFSNEDREKAIIEFKNSWDEFRNDIARGLFEYTDLIKAQKYSFMKALKEVLEYKENSNFVNINFRDLYFHYNFCRTTTISDNEDMNNINFNRFIPNSEFINDDNRFSPKKVEYLYLAYKTSLNYKEIESIALSEIRAKSGSKVGICKFEINLSDDLNNKNIIDLAIADNKTFEEIERSYAKEEEIYMKEVISVKHIINNKKLTKSKNKTVEKIKENSIKCLLEIYFKILSAEIFKPVDGVEKGKKYAPFHCMAYYFKSIGYDGIRYKSTVWNGAFGGNIVLFNKNYAIPKEFRIEMLNRNY